MLFFSYLAKRTTLTKLVCSVHLMHVWFLGVVSFSLLGLEDKAWPKNVQLDQSTVNRELWDHHNHAIQNVITFEDMQEDKTPRVIVILRNIFTQPAFFCDLPCLFWGDSLLHGGKWATCQATDVVLLRAPHTESGLLLFCECKHVPQGIYLLPDPFSLQYLNVFSSIMTCTIPGTSPWALFYVETVCSRSTGNWVETVSLCKESRVISTAGRLLSTGRQM